MKLYNTLTRTKEEFTPIEPGQVGLYTCGPTVYHYAHIGNLRTYIFEDILRRTLEANEYEVHHVMNITDVGHLTDDGNDGEDKMEKGAAREHKTVWEVAEYYTAAFQTDMERLNITPPTTWCKATDHIPEQIAMVEQLAAKGLTYETGDGIYFDTAKFSSYGEMAKLDIAGLQEGARVDMGEKRNATDFALWKFSSTDSQRAMEWEAFGRKGFPGWHIECSAMSLKYLGNHFDIHCGGVDHIQVHHTNEIAQNEGVTGAKSVNVWMHGEFLLTNDDRMGKSKGNFLTLQSLMDKEYDPLAYRFFVIGGHYRSLLNFTFEALDGATAGLNKLRQQVRLWAEQTDTDATPQTADSEYMNQFMEAMNDDLDTPAALAVVWEMAKSNISNISKLATILAMDNILGLNLRAVSEEQIDGTDAIPDDITQMLADREQARANKDWPASDSLRDQIQAAGYVIEDTPEGSRVYKA